MIRRFSSHLLLSAIALGTSLASCDKNDSISPAYENNTPTPQYTPSNPSALGIPSIPPSLTDAAHPSAPPKTSVEVGKVRFHLLAPPKDPNELIVLRKLETAHDQLAKYFGQDSVTMREQSVCPIFYNPQERRPDSLASLLRPLEVTTDTKGRPVRVELGKELELHLVENDVPETHVLTHELFHLFVQRSALMSQSYTEGHAHAIQALLHKDEYKTGRRAGGAGSYPKLRSLVSIGLDYTFYDQEYLGAGIQDPKLRSFVLGIWEHAWLKYLEIDPEYFKKFYRKLALRRAAGHSAFSKKELDSISESVSPGYIQWQRNNVPSMTNLDRSTGERLAVAFLQDGGQSIIVVNIETVRRSSDNSVIIAPANTGPITFWTKDKYGQRRFEKIRDRAGAFEVITMPPIPPGMILESVSIGTANLDVHSI